MMASRSRGVETVGALIENGRTAALHPASKKEATQ
jgi:hypothetical protein